MPQAANRKPTMSEIVRSALAFDSLSIHISCQDGPHAIISFAPQARAAWEALAHAVFPHMGPERALRKLIDDEIHSAPMRLSINASHGLAEPCAPPDDPDDPDDVFSPEPPQPWASRLETIRPDRIGNPTVVDKRALLHLALIPSDAQHWESVHNRARHLPPPPTSHAVDAARALAGFLEPMLGFGAISIIASGWNTRAGRSAADSQRDLSAFRKSPECSSALQSALDQAILQYETPSSPASSTPSRL